MTPSCSDIYCAKQGGNQQVFILRKRTDTKTYLYKNRHILADFSLIAIPHEREQIEPLNLPWLPADRLMFCGPLLRRTRSDIQLDDVRKTYELTPDEPTIVITNGGEMDWSTVMMSSCPLC